MWALLVNDADAPLQITKNHQLFPRDFGFDWGAIAFADFFWQANRDPVLSHHLPCRYLAFNLAQQQIVHVRDHPKIFNGAGQRGQYTSPPKNIGSGKTLYCLPRHVKVDPYVNDIKLRLGKLIYQW